MNRNRIFSVTGVPLGVGMIFFALPTSTAIYALSSRFGSYTKLASAAIMIFNHFVLFLSLGCLDIGSSLTGDA
ncbi:MAG: hypothetical protein KKD47_06070 [Proteobacteria bacterium]|nr:hypothetical protein [Pseudomonadota bacterium]